MRLIWSLAAVGIVAWGDRSLSAAGAGAGGWTTSSSRSGSSRISPASATGFPVRSNSSTSSPTIRLAGSPFVAAGRRRRGAGPRRPARLVSAIDRRPAIYAAALAAGLALAAAVICLIWPGDSLLAMTRLANPLGNAAWPPVNDLAFKHRVERLAVGRPFEVELIDRNHRMPDDVRIEYRSTSPNGRRADLARKNAARRR